MDEVCDKVKAREDIDGELDPNSKVSLPLAIRKKESIM